MTTDTNHKYGARIYYLDDGVILIKQTRLAIGGPKSGDYVIDTDSNGGHIEQHVDPGQNDEFVAAVLEAGRGEL